MVISVRMPESIVCVHISGVWYICDMQYAVCSKQSDHAPIIMSLKYNIERKTIPHKFEECTCWRKSGLNDIDTYKLNLDYIYFECTI